MNLTLSVFLLIIVGMIIPVSAQSFESSGSENYLFLGINKDKVSGIMRTDSKITSINSEIKFYNNGNFKIKLFQDRLILYGSPDKLKVTVLDLNERQRIFFDIYEISTQSLTPKETEHIGMPDIVAQQAEEKAKQEAIEEAQRLDEIANKIPRSEYTLSEERKIAILDQTMKRVSVFKFFDFDIRIVDPEKNNLFDYYRTDGFVDDVEITSIVRDGEGNILNSFTGITSKKGHYAPEQMTYFDDNINTNLPFSLKVLATAYFDDATFATASLFKEFFVYVPSSEKRSECNTGYVMATNGTCVITKEVIK